MKFIKSYTGNYSYDNSIPFSVPAYSKLLNVFMDAGNITILVEFDDLEEEVKTIIITKHEGIVINKEMFGNSLKYWGTITTNNSNLINNSNSIPNGINISINIFNENKYTHIFYEELKSLSEMRNEKIIEVLY